MSDAVSREDVVEYLKSQLWIDGFVEVPADELIVAIRALPAMSAKHDFSQLEALTAECDRLRIALTDAESYLKRGLDKSALSLMSSVLKENSNATPNA